MKNRIKILSGILALVLMSCGNSTKQTGNEGMEGTNGTVETNGTTGNGTSDTYYSRDPEVNDNITGDDNTNNNSNMQSNGTINNAPANGTGSTTAQDRNLTQEQYDKQRNAQMYTDLKMTDEQIQKYESSSRTSMDTWMKDNPNKTMTVQERMKIQRDNLQPILDESQFQNYGQWSTSNPYRN